MFQAELGQSEFFKGFNEVCCPELLVFAVLCELFIDKGDRPLKVITRPLKVMTDEFEAAVIQVLVNDESDGITVIHIAYLQILGFQLTAKRVPRSAAFLSRSANTRAFRPSSHPL